MSKKKSAMSKKPAHAPKVEFRRLSSFKNSVAASDAQSLKSDRVFRQVADPATTLTHNPFEKLKLK